MPNGSERLGAYELVKKVGEGGERVVWEAVCIEDTEGVQRGERVALSCLRDREAAVFQREIELLGKLAHKNIVRYRHSFTCHEASGEICCLVTELLYGRTLKDLIREHRQGMPWKQAQIILYQVLEALRYLASNEVVHRDLKPSNIFVTDSGVVKLIDFGIARQRKEEDSGVSNGGIKGSFDYLAPEFVRATPTDFRGDERSDIFSFGICAYEMLTGRLPLPSLGSHLNYRARWTSRDLPKFEFKHGFFRVFPKAQGVIAGCLEVERERGKKRIQSFELVMAEFDQIRPLVISYAADTYEFTELLGKGGFGEVFKAIHRQGNRELGFVAVKRLMQAGNPGRFSQEAKILKNKFHRNLVRYVDFVEQPNITGSQYYLVMEYLQGMPGLSLRERIRSSASGLEPLETLQLFVAYLDCLGHLHKEGIFHRDIKPANLYAPVGNPSGAKIFDLGIARVDDVTRTHGQVPGTLDYMPPEFARQSNERGTAESDIYSIGVSLFEALTRDLPLPRLPKADRDGWMEYIRRALEEASVYEARYSFQHPVFSQYPSLVGVLKKTLAYSPSDRFESAYALKERLIQLVEVWERQREAAAAAHPADLPDGSSSTTEPTPIAILGAGSRSDMERPPSPDAAERARQQRESRVQDALCLAEQSLMENRYDQCRDHCRNVLFEIPGHPRAEALTDICWRLQEAHGLLDAGDALSALQVFREAHRQHPTEQAVFVSLTRHEETLDRISSEVEAFIRTAETAVSQGTLAEAKEACARALGLIPNHTRARRLADILTCLMKIQAAEQSRDTAEADSLLKALANSYPAEPLIEAFCVQVESRLRQRQQDLDGNLEAALGLLARGELASGIQALISILVDHPNHTRAALLLEIARTLYRAQQLSTSGELQEAFALLQKAAEKWPAEPLVLQACSLAKTTVETLGNELESLHARAEAAASKGEFGSARELCRAALVKDRGHAQTLVLYELIPKLQTAAAAGRRGDWAQMSRHLSELQAKHPDHSVIAALRQQASQGASAQEILLNSKRAEVELHLRNQNFSGAREVCRSILSVLEHPGANSLLRCLPRLEQAFELARMSRWQELLESLPDLSQDAKADPFLETVLTPFLREFAARGAGFREDLAEKQLDSVICAISARDYTRARECLKTVEPRAVRNARSENLLKVIDFLERAQMAGREENWVQELALLHEARSLFPAEDSIVVALERVEAERTKREAIQQQNKGLAGIEQALSAKDYQKAHDLARAIVQGNPHMHRARTLMRVAVSLRQANEAVSNAQWSKAVKLLREAHRVYPDEERVRRALAETEEKRRQHERREALATALGTVTEAGRAKDYAGMKQQLQALGEQWPDNAEIRALAEVADLLCEASRALLQQQPAAALELLNSGPATAAGHPFVRDLVVEIEGLLASPRTTPQVNVASEANSRSQSAEEVLVSVKAAFSRLELSRVLELCRGARKDFPDRIEFKAMYDVASALQQADEAGKSEDLESTIRLLRGALEQGVPEALVGQRLAELERRRLQELKESRVASLIGEIQLAKKAGKFEEALAACKALLQDVPMHPLTQAQLGLFQFLLRAEDHTKSGDWAKAVTELQEARRRYPEEECVRERLAQAEAQQANLAQSARLANHLTFAEDAVVHGKYDVAADLCRVVLEQSPVHGRAQELLKIASCLRDARQSGTRGDWDSAVKILREASEMFPQEASIHAAYSDAQHRRRALSERWANALAEVETALNGRAYDKARKLCEIILREAPTYRPAELLLQVTSYLKLAEDASRNSDWPGAIRLLQEAQHYYPEDVRIRECLGDARLQQKHQADKRADQLLTVEELITGKDFERAEEICAEILRETPEEPSAVRLQDLARTLRESVSAASAGEWDRVTRLLERYRRHYPEDARVEEARAEAEAEKIRIAEEFERRRKRFVLFAALLLFGVLLLAGGGYFYYWNNSMKKQSPSTEEQESGRNPPPSTP